MEEKGKKEEG